MIRRITDSRSVLRYIWIVASLIAIMSQINFEPETIKATAKASTWAGISTCFGPSSGQIIHRMLQHYGLNASIEQLLKKHLIRTAIGTWACQRHGTIWL